MNAAYAEMNRTQRKFLLEHYVVLPGNEIAEGLAGGNKLDACQKELVELFLRADGPLDVAWLVERFEYERAGGDFGASLRKISKAVGDGAAVVVKGITQPLIAVAKALAEIELPRGGSRESGDRGASGPGAREPGDHPHSAPPALHGPAWGQANGVNVSGW